MNWNYNTGILKANGSQIKLPTRQADVFEYLATKEGNKATTGEIFGAIYGNAADTYPQKRIIKVHARRLAKRLESVMLNLEVIRRGCHDGIYCLKLS